MESPGGAVRDSEEWVRDLTATGAARETAAHRLHGVLLRVARAELNRRSASLPIGGPERDDLAYQCAADAMVTVLAKLEQFRGESRFTTWAYKFVIFEVSNKIGRHFWRTRPSYLPGEDWNALPDRFGINPEQHAEGRELVAALHEAVHEELTPRQREIFAALVLDEVPLDALALRLGLTRNAVYQTMFNVRRKLRSALAARGFLRAQTESA